MSTPARKTCLICIDGWGVTDEDKGNAVLHAETPVMDAFAKGEMNNAYATLDASGLAVGLPEGLMGNSEVGHQNIGAGQVVFQDIARIDVSLKVYTRSLSSPHTLSPYPVAPLVKPCSRFWSECV
eukprot:TRINITY_DN28915_c0_g1_i1.p2 TRINITY_DN28915_c0_g1~~TRINITY_DN28915_c0_g1_i1.p2  ORF type:complete len:125 (-),score=29.76 TRINITY_DN28915_c0_g1_i1:16-390(-)